VKPSVRLTLAHVENGGSPGGALEPVRKTRQEAEHAGASLSALFMQDQQGGKERSHEEMVALIRGAIEKKRASLREFVSDPDAIFDPAAWIRDEIINANTRRILAEIPVHTKQTLAIELGATPYAKLIMAWDIIALPTYKSEYRRGRAEYGMQERAKILGHDIILDPTESKLLDAMAEAVGISNPYGHVTNRKKALK
jgi:hypothetical protein